MNNNPRALNQLFGQLGLANDEFSIKRFMTHHPLEDHAQLADALFWTEPQAAFIRTHMLNDAIWSAPLDELDTLLHR
jgi:hypothetical protein